MAHLHFTDAAIPEAEADEFRIAVSIDQGFVSFHARVSVDNARDSWHQLGQLLAEIDAQRRNPDPQSMSPSGEGDDGSPSSTSELSGEIPY